MMTGFKQVLIFIGMLILTIVGGYLYNNNKETFHILNDKGRYGKLRLGSLNAKDCQDKCAQMKNCKYVQRPRNLELWDAGHCYIYTDPYQMKVGNGAMGDNSTWRNKNWIEPPPPKYIGSYGGYSFRSRKAADDYCKSTASQSAGKSLSLCHSSQVTEHKGGGENVCNSGWTLDRKGWWQGRFRGWGCGSTSQRWNYWSPGPSSAHCCENMPERN
jgi:hypothetical protein